MVMFRADVSYRTAFERGEVQARMLERWTAGHDDLDSIDIDACIEDIRAALPPLQ